MRRWNWYACLAGLFGSLWGWGCHADPIPAAERYPAGTPFRAQALVVDGTRLRLIDSGQGPAVVFIHGLGASMYSWRHQLGPVVDAGSGHRVVAFDNRGMGFSERPRTGGGYDNAAYTRLLLALLDSLRITDAVLVGHSMGGAVALEAALTAPERVRGLVLIGSAGLGVRVPGALSMARTPFVGPVVAAFRGRASTAALLRSTYGDPEKVTETDIDQYYAPAGEPGYMRALRTILRQFRFDAFKEEGGRLEGVRAPTLVVWGARDVLIPVALGRQLAASLPRAALVVIPNAGHVVQEESPDAVTPLILSFLKEGLPRVPENLAMAH